MERRLRVMLTPLAHTAAVIVKYKILFFRCFGELSLSKEVFFTPLSGRAEHHLWFPSLLLSYTKKLTLLRLILHIPAQLTEAMLRWCKGTSVRMLEHKPITRPILTCISELIDILHFD